VAAKEQGVEVATYSEMIDSFDGQLGAFAYLVFVLLYMPCVAATAAIYRETGRTWAIFVSCWATGIAYGTATIVYQLGTFGEHPASSSGWILAMLGTFWFVLRRMRRMGGDDDDTGSGPTQPPAPKRAIEPAPTMLPTPSASNARSPLSLPTGDLHGTQ
jgi:ferrous iron transport protein B